MKRRLSPRVETVGTGTYNVVLVGGLAEGNNTQAALRREIAGVGDYKVTSFDPDPLPSEGITEYRHHQSKVEQVRDILDGIDDKATLVGHSQGAGIALRAALDQPDKVDRVILMNPNGLMKDSFPRLAGRFVLETVRKTFTPTRLAQKQQWYGMRYMLRHPRAFIGEALDIARYHGGKDIDELRERGVCIDIVLSNKDQVFPWRKIGKALESDEIAYDGLSMVCHAIIGRNDRPRMKKSASKYAGHDNNIINPAPTAELIDQIIQQR